MMVKFKFSNYTPANVAKPAKVTANRGKPAAKPLLNFANKEHQAQHKHNTLASISKTVATQDSTKINSLSNISNVSNGRRVNSEKTILQKQIDDLWAKADKLADWIDNPASNVLLQERAARVPEVQRMALEIDRLIKQKLLIK